MWLWQVRKMRCDDRPEGCVPCQQNQTECKTTDRITGKATVRGYVESLERKIQELESRNSHLMNRVKSLGGDLSIQDGHFTGPASSGGTQWSRDDPNLGPNSHEMVNSAATDDGDARNQANLETSYKSQSRSNSGNRLPKFRSGLTGNNYLGVSTGDSLLSSIRGTSMNVLGMEIDIADYTSPDVDEPDPAQPEHQPVYNKSYCAFIQTAFGANPRLPKVDLPPRKEGLKQANIYFRGLNPFLPLLHGPTFMRTVSFPMPGLSHSLLSSNKLSFPAPTTIPLSG